MLTSYLTRTRTIPFLHFKNKHGEKKLGYDYDCVLFSCNIRVTVDWMTGQN